ncbi:hypothetical protein AQUCO_05700118v1 [Aquilegia coerulea]|uniref:ZF-HD dimerization-type domain-containing protein n=1 Tax=Aquilegia coerulea TaxID=218851 RepID=A0A2G5CFU9_AQUCA|nr:hypothetical protein AQUCO_05700118v1 [Aquilegia coerulea]
MKKSCSKKKFLYKECQQNQAARLGKYATDGCNEFILNSARSETGMYCLACHCHRNSHRKVSVQEKDADFGASGAEEKKRKSDDGTITIEILSGTTTKKRYREEAETREDLHVYSFRVHNLIARGKLTIKLEKEIPQLIPK